MTIMSINFILGNYCAVSRALDVPALFRLIMIITALTVIGIIKHFLLAIFNLMVPVRLKSCHISNCYEYNYVAHS